jgi:hypothetical protein
MRKTREGTPRRQRVPEAGAEAGRTLGRLIEARMALLAVCRRCKHRRVLYPRNLVDRFGADCPAIELREYLRCSACRSRSANLHESAR